MAQEKFPYQIYRNLPENQHYGLYHSSEGLSPEEWHRLTGLASIEEITFGFVNTQIFTESDLYAYQEWLFDSRRLYTGLCGYLENWTEGGGTENAPNCFFYGLGGWCLGEDIDQCNLDNIISPLDKNLLWKINNKIGASKYYDPVDGGAPDSNYVGHSCLGGRQCRGSLWYLNQSQDFSETCIPDVSQIDIDAPINDANGWPQLGPEYCKDDWRAIPNIYIDYDSNLDDLYSGDDISIMRYYGFTTDEYLISSAPNVVSLYFNLAKNDGEPEINYFNDNIWSNPSGEVWVECNEGSTEGENEGYCGGYGFNYETQEYDGSVYFTVTTWDYQSDLENDGLDNGIIIPNNNSELEYQQIVNNAFNIKKISGINEILQHQYNSPGLKEIRVLAFSLHEDGYINLLKRIKIRVFLGLDDVYIEDFSDLGGPDFVFIPWPHENIPVIGGISRATDFPLYNGKNSNYIKSLLKILKGNYFEADDQLNRAFTQQSLMNDEMGYWPGRLDLQQTRVFKNGSWDMAKLLMIEDRYEDTLSIKGNHTFHPYDDKFYWDGYFNYFPEETCVGQLFISDNMDVNKKSDIILELNGSEYETTFVRDSSGNNNKGILIGDYKISKSSPGNPLTRESVIDLPTFDSKKGAF